MKPKGLGELWAATSDLANQTGIEKTDLLLFMANLEQISLNLQSFSFSALRPFQEHTDIRAYM